MSSNEKRKEEKKNGYETIKGWMESEAMRAKIERSLPVGMAVDSWIEASLTVIRMDADLSRCEPMSLIGALMTLASLGLRLEGPLGQAYLVARPVKVWDPQTRRKEWSHHEAQVQIGYKGLLDLAWRNPEVQDIEAHIVHEHDLFEFELGTNQFLKHVWDPTAGSRGDRIVVYSGLRFKNGYYSFRVYPIDDVMELRKSILEQNGVRIELDADGREHYMRRDKNTGNEYEWKYDSAKTMPWIGHLPPMILKTAIRRSATYWRLNPDFERAAAMIEADEAGLSQRLAEMAKSFVPEGVLTGKQFSGQGTSPQSRGEANTLAASKALTEQMVREASARKQKETAESSQESGSVQEGSGAEGQDEVGSEDDSRKPDSESRGAEPFVDDPSGLTQEELEELEAANKKK